MGVKFILLRFIRLNAERLGRSFRIKEHNPAENPMQYYG